MNKEFIIIKCQVPVQIVHRVKGKPVQQPTISYLNESKSARSQIFRKEKYRC